MIAKRSGLARLQEWFARGDLVRPRAADRPDLVDVVRALAQACEAEIPSSRHSRHLCDHVAGCSHLVFVLVDGLGAELLADLIPGGFLHRHQVEEIEAVFPSTTSVALTSLTTAEYASVHGIPGWFAWLPELGISSEVLPFVERFGKRPLADYGGHPDQLFALPSVFPRFRRRQLVVTRQYICNTTYSRYWCGGCTSSPYERIEDGVDRVLERVHDGLGSSYTHLYINHLDSLCHEKGIDHADITALARHIDRQLERLASSAGSSVRILITADHGHVNAGKDLQVHPGDPLMRFLTCAPTGEARVPVFHLRSPGDQECREGFRRIFEDCYGETFALISSGELEDLELLGPGRMSPRARSRYGDFIATAAGTHTLRFTAPGHSGHRQRGVHAGLTHAEMAIPLIVV